MSTGMQRIVLCISFAATAWGCGLPERPSPAAAQLSPAELINGGHDLRARSVLAPLVEAEPDNATALWLLSKSWSGLGRMDTALELAERAVALDTGNAVYHVQLAAVLGRVAERASIFKQLGLARRAKKELDAALSLDPRNLDALYGEMMYYFAAPSFLGGDRTRAQEFVDRITAIDPVRGWLAQASLAHERKDPAGELDFLLRAVDTDPENFDARGALLQFYFDQPQRDYGSIEETGCRLLQVDPSRPDGWRALADAHAACHCWTELTEIVQRAALFNPEDLSPYYAAAIAMMREGERWEVARYYLEKYLSQPADGSEPSLASARWQLARVLDHLKRPEDAQAQLELALKEDPGLDVARQDLKRLKGK